MYLIVVQGGASINECRDQEMLKRYDDAVRRCVKQGFQMLEQGGSAVDAVEAAVRALEDEELFDAGIGSCLTSAGTIEMDAMIMDGATAKLGSVGCVDFTDHPISLARLVMDQSPHCMFVGPGAMDFARSRNFPILPSKECLFTEKAKNDFAKYKDFATALKSQMNVPGDGSSDTVGAVALDKHGNLACATSTGGICGKLPGRVGDAPIVGCGGYANTNGAASCTGHGESLMRMMCCKSVVDNIEGGKSPKEASRITLNNIFQKTGSCGGVICVDKSGEVGIFRTAEFMPWASYSSEDGIRSFADLS